MTRVGSSGSASSRVAAARLRGGADGAAPSPRRRCAPAAPTARLRGGSRRGCSTFDVAHTTPCRWNTPRGQTPLRTVEGCLRASTRSRASTKSMFDVWSDMATKGRTPPHHRPDPLPTFVAAVHDGRGEGPPGEGRRPVPDPPSFVAAVHAARAKRRRERRRPRPRPTHPRRRRSRGPGEAARGKGADQAPTDPPPSPPFTRPKRNGRRERRRTGNESMQSIGDFPGWRQSRPDAGKVPAN